jgi:hypothetical protein
MARTIRLRARVKPPKTELQRGDLARLLGDERLMEFTADLNNIYRAASSVMLRQDELVLVLAPRDERFWLGAGYAYVCHHKHGVGCVYVRSLEAVR